MREKMAEWQKQGNSSPVRGVHRLSASFPPPPPEETGPGPNLFPFPICLSDRQKRQVSPQPFLRRRPRTRFLLILIDASPRDGGSSSPVDGWNEMSPFANYFADLYLSPCPGGIPPKTGESRNSGCWLAWQFSDETEFVQRNRLETRRT